MRGLREIRRGRGGSGKQKGGSRATVPVLEVSLRGKKDELNKKLMRIKRGKKRVQFL